MISVTENDTPKPYAVAALRYRSAGWESVLPIKPARTGSPRKGPPPEGYTGRGAVIPSTPDVYAWIEAVPHGNVCLRLPDGVLGIDVDDYGLKQGGATLADAEARWGPLPPTWTSSARPGMSGIRFFRVPKGLKWPGQLPGGDVELILATHRYAVVWPSVHPDTGETYRWTDPAGQRSISVPSVHELADLPAAWVSGLTGGEEDRGQEKTDVDFVAAMTWLTAQPGFTAEPCPVMGRVWEAFGERSGSMHEHAMAGVLRLVRRVAEQHPGGANVLGRMRTAFITDVTGAGRGRNDYEAAQEWVRLVEGAVGIVLADPSEPACNCYGQRDRAELEWLQASTAGSAGQVGPEGAQEGTDGSVAARELPEGISPRVDWTALFGEQQEEEWISFPLLPERRHIAVYSEPKVGKSLLMLELAVAIARGGDFLGHSTTARRVLYVDFENDMQGDIRERLEAMEVGPADLDDLVYLSMPSLAALNTPQGAVELVRNVRHYDCRVVVIDTVSRAVHGEENSNDTWLAFYRNTGISLKREGVAMVRLDHSGKDTTKGARGGSAKAGDVDAIWSLSKISDGETPTFRLECTHRRFPLAEDMATVTFARQEQPLRSVPVGGRGVAFQLKVAACTADMVGLDIPREWGSTKVRAALKAAGFRHSNSVISAAIRDHKAVDNIGPISHRGSWTDSGTGPQGPGPVKPALTREEIVSVPPVPDRSRDRLERSPSPGLPIGGPGTASNNGPIPDCDVCGLRMPFALPGQKTHPSCEEEE